MMNINQKPAIPKSLHKKRIKYILIRTISCLLLLIASLIIIILWGDVVFSMPSQDYEITRTLFYITFLILPFVITGIPIKLIDSSWSGIILDVKVEESIGTYTLGGRAWPYSKNDLVLTIKKDSGKEINYTVLSLGIKDKPWNNVPIIGKIENHTTKYQVGDRVYKYYGFKHLYVFNRNCEDSLHCIVCGAINKNQDSECWACHSELIL